MKTLILVDIQNDFVPGGALAVADGDQVVAVANHLMPKFKLVVATQDWHPADHGSFASQHEGVQVGDVFSLNGIQQVAWPDHCVQDAFGAKFVAGLNVNSINHVVQKGTDPQIDSYSGFFDNDQRSSTGLADLLKNHGTTEVVVMGLATDYCVKFTALDAVRLGFTTTVILPGCRGVELQPGDIAAAVEQMRSAGVQFVKNIDGV